MQLGNNILTLRCGIQCGGIMFIDEGIIPLHIYILTRHRHN